jgi:transcriptional regulator with XRE-family HTH domain
VDKSISSPQYRTFLRQLRLARKRSGLSQIELAARIDETQSFVSKCERGERRLDLIELRIFCRAFGISLSSFVEALEGVLAAPTDRTKPRRQGNK